MASVNGASCAMCIKSPATLAECSPDDHQQRIRRFKIKRPFSLKIDIDQKEWPRLIFAEQLGCGAEPESDLSDSIYPNYCTAMSNVATKFFARRRTVAYASLSPTENSPIRFGPSVAERRIVLPPVTAMS